jgi:hypothetical protein
MGEGEGRVEMVRGERGEAMGDGSGGGLGTVLLLVVVWVGR